MSVKKNTSRKRRIFYATAAMAGLVALSGIETTPVSAAAPERTNIRNLIQISAQDASPAESLKKEMIANRIELDPSISPEAVKIDSSRIELSGFNRNKTGLQTVNAQIYLDQNQNGSASLSSSFTERTTILVNRENKPQIQLKSDKVVVNNSDAWNPFYYISYINDDSKILPAVKVEGKVDMSTDGDYPVTYTAVDQEGNTSEVSLTVSVRTPEEVIRAQEEAERLAREEEERRLAEEEAARLEAERLAQEEEQARQEEAAANAAAAAAAVAYSAASGSATGNSIVDAARAWAGVGYYVWGGNNPATGADCSGFTQYVYSLYGINLPHNNLAQAASGYPVSASEALPGDIVVWDAHVGIYTGNGYYVSALNPSVGICEIPISSSQGSGSYWGIYRIPGVN